MNIKKKLKIAFLGGAINSAVGNAHISAIRLDNEYDLVAGCFSRNRELNRKTASQYGVNKYRVYDSLTDLLKKEEKKIDAVVILTPTNQHKQQVLTCIQKGIPVICEKALATSSSEIEKIRAALEKNDGFLTVVYNYIGYPVIRELKSLIDRGKIGKIHHIQIEMPQENYKRMNTSGEPIVPQEWRLHDQSIPTISLDLGVHLHMLVKYLTNETPVKVVAKSESIGNFSNIIDNVNCIIEYTNNMSCNMWYSKIATGNRNGLKIRIYGQKGSAEWLQEMPEILNFADTIGRRWMIDRGNEEVKICNKHRYTRFKAGHPAGFLEAFANYYQDIAISLHYYKENNSVILEECFGIDEAYEGIQLFEAIQNSSQTRAWENVT